MSNFLLNQFLSQVNFAEEAALSKQSIGKFTFSVRQ